MSFSEIEATKLLTLSKSVNLNSLRNITLIM
jgi:hypothetical protein